MSRRFALVLLLLLLPFLGTLLAGFQADDYWFVGDASLAAVLRACSGDWLTGAHGSGWFRPVTRFCFYVDDFLWGIRFPAGYHLTNCLLHLANVSLFLLLLRRLSVLRGGGEPVVAFLVLVPFAWYPPTAATVAWVASRTDLLAMTGILGGLVVFHGGPELRWRDAAAFAGTVLFALLSKESAYVLPGLLVVSLVAAPEFSRARLRRWGVLLGMALVIEGIVLAWRFHFLGGVGGYGGQFQLHGFRGVIRQVAECFGRSFAPLAALELLRRWHAAIALVVVAGAFVAAGERRRVVVAGGLFWALACVSIGSLPLLPVENARFLAVPSIGVGLALAAGVASLVERARRGGTAVGVVMAVWFGVASVASALPWIEASRDCERYAVAMVRASRGAEGLIAVVAENMDPASYELSSVHARAGGKILPWDQAKWVMARRAPGHWFDWGLHPETMDKVCRVLVLRGPGASPVVTAYDVVGAGDAADASYEYAVVEMASTRPVQPRFVARDGEPEQSVFSVIGSPPGVPTRHWFHLGLESHDWRFDPVDADSIVTSERRYTLRLRRWIY